MAYLVDTSVLVQLADHASIFHADASWAVAKLHRRGQVLHATPQVLVEFRSVATRPTAVNGLGITPIDTEAHATAFEAMFPLLPETPAIYPAWKSLVGVLGVIGKQVQDARLVAVCHVHSLTHVLTFNGAHFLRLAG